MQFIRRVTAAARNVHPINNPIETWRHIRFLARALRYRCEIKSWLQAGNVGGLVESLDERPEMMGVIEWPYLHRDWNVNQRFHAVRGHYVELENLPWLRVGVNEARVLCELMDVAPGLHIVLDRPQWFLREGELTINLFVDDTRVYSLAFALGCTEGRRTAFIGAMQGRDIENIESTYKELTKKLHGSRPRDFLFTVFQLLCEVADVQCILGVSDECRHHRHPYFATKQKKTQSANYDSIWTDRGGVASTTGFFQLPNVPAVRLEREIPSQKRAMYRRRYALFDRIRDHILQFAGGERPTFVHSLEGAPFR